ncbi:GNAT family N-acetyltransferase [Aromatoleum toluolicum]|uniref:peptidogalycan biosysnthesis protein n=1 Tax=Aromatoleum toluolicum TaxID=90060 RepID=UPI001FE6959E|nr:peptidogalycan biosysnthesis protein [Aromatoleum toluolicum]MCQ6963986.1 GNAT family N-acetyltransferase [Aromatoleum toluolicum]
MSKLTIRISDGAADIPREAWTALCAPGHPFLNGDFLRIVEEHGVAVPDAGWQPLHLVASENGTIVGLLPLYLKGHSHGDFIYDWSWKAVWERLGHRYYPRLVSGLPYTPVAGPRLLIAPAASDRAAVCDALITAAQGIVADNGFSTWHVALASSADIDALAARGLLVSHDVQYQWFDQGFGDFDGFLQCFAAEKRRKVRAERRRAAESGLRC